MPARQRLLVVCGTRPEAIKLAPLVLALRGDDRFELELCASGQHREMLRQVFSLFDLEPDHDLDVMRDGQGLAETTGAILNGLAPLLRERRPDRLIVHGDTNTTLSASLAAFYAGVPVAHVEAGLRTGNIRSPWPEEANRRIAAVLADRHYAPTERARANLLSENLPSGHVVVTGNTVIDALLMVSARLETDGRLARSVEERLPVLDERRKLVLVTGHRRENFGAGLESFCDALERLARRPDVQIVFPVHPNPKVREPVARRLGGVDDVVLIDPLEYLPFVALMKRAHFVISDSGGVQEEAPSLGVPVLVTRDTTERPEAVEAGTVVLVGTAAERIVEEAERLLEDAAHHRAMSNASNPFGDGRACDRIVEDLAVARDAVTG